MSQKKPLCPKHRTALVELDAFGHEEPYNSRMKKGDKAPKVDLVCNTPGCKTLNGPECPRCRRFYRIRLAEYKNPDLPKAYYCPREDAAFNL